MSRKLSRQEAFDIVNGERDYQEKKWPGICLAPSEVVRLIRAALMEADSLFDIAKDTTRGDALRVNPSDLETFRKVAAICVRCMEEHGCPHRQIMTHPLG